MKWRKKIVLCLLCLLVNGMVVLLESCRKKDAGHQATAYHFTVPAGFPPPTHDFSAAPLTEEGIALGRRLFYEGRLSKDGNYPCSSCHQQFAGFGTYDHDLSHGFNDSHTLRNAPGLANLAWKKAFGWDGGFSSMEAQILSHLTAPNEMAETVENILAKLRADTAYPARFQAAYGDPTINSQRLLNALSQFLLTLVSANSKYDRVLKGIHSFTAAEEAGYQLFQSKCASCHQEPLLTDGTYRNNGLPLNPLLKDQGRMRITGQRADSLRFRVPALRNTAMSFPFMHDGRLWTLTDLVIHYRSGITAGPTLDPSLQGGVQLTDTEAQQLISFLRTLTDSTFLQDPKFARPQ